MFRRLTLSVAMTASCCLLSGFAQAQTGENTRAISAKPKMELATYQRSYKSDASAKTPASLASCQTCNSAYGGGGNMGGPNAMAYGRVWGGAQSNRDSARFNHYPYVYYPQNYMGDEYFRSSDSMYYRYPPEMQIPVYNRHWHNYYPSPRRYHWGHHFITDVF